MPDPGEILWEDTCSDITFDTNQVCLPCTHSMSSPTSDVSIVPLMCLKDGGCLPAALGGSSPWGIDTAWDVYTGLGDHTSLCAVYTDVLGLTPSQLCSQ